MKITTLILFLAIMQVSATTLAQKVSIKASNQPLSTIFDQISNQTGFDFAYTTKTLENAKPVTINVKNEELEQVLKKIFDGQPLEFTIKDRFVTVTVKQPTVLDKIKSAVGLNQIDVKGYVYDEKVQPIPGATVIVKGTNNSTITAPNGEFHLKNVSDNATIVISFIGYQKLELPVKPDMGIVNLSVSINQLDAVHVIAYGQTTQRMTTGNIAVVTAKDIESQPVTNPLLALQGKIPGLFITQASGISGSGVTVRIQGQNSISNGNDPLYVIDGMPYTSQLLPGVFNILGNSGGSATAGTYNNGSPLSFINPSDIESIEVLKDADATAIYGSRAANGAILITTKKGKAGQTKADINLQEGWGQVDRRMNVLNTPQYLQMRSEAFKNDGLTPSSTDYDVNGLWDKNRQTDWQKALIGNTAHYQNFQGNVSGGNEMTQFLIGANYNRQTTVFPGDFADQKFSMHVNLANESANRKFKIQFSASYMVDQNSITNVDLTLNALEIPPNAPSLYNKDGSLNWAQDANGNSSWYNPLAYLENTYKNRTNNLISSGMLTYNILPGLTIKSNFGFNTLVTNELALSPISALPPEQRVSRTATNTFGTSELRSWNIEPQLTYDRVIGKSKLNLLLGTTYQSDNAAGKQFVGNGYTSDLLLADINAAPNVYSSSATDYLYRYTAVFARANYVWEDKYIIDLNGRRDGSSRFGADDQFHNFGSIGASWIFTEESFFKNKVAFLSFGKIRSSYGTTGSDQIPNYAYLTNYGVNSFPIPYQQQISLNAKNLSNPFLQWEETRKFSIGMDLGFFKDRILLTANYARNRSSNQLLQYLLPAITGFTGINDNFPATVQNTNLEFSLNTVNIKNSNFSWNTSVNFTIPHNKLIAFPNLANSSYSTQLIVGQPLNIVKLFDFAGVNTTNGQYQFRASNGQITATPDFSNDMNKFVSLDPKYYGGIQNNFKYKSFQLDFLFQFVKQIGRDVTHGLDVLPGTFYGTSSLGNQPVSILNRWQKSGDLAPNAGYTTLNGGGFGLFYVAYSTAGYADASFIRLKNARISYQLPEAWRRKYHLLDFKIFAQGQNLLTITKYAGLDPETLSTGSLPPLRVITAGVQVTF